MELYIKSGVFCNISMPKVKFIVREQHLQVLDNIMNTIKVDLGVF